LTENDGGQGPYDVIVIGGGPAGATAALYAARADLSTLVLDKGLRTGALGMANTLVNYPGIPGPISGAELLQTIRGQAESFGAQFLQQKVLSADLTEPVKRASTSHGTYESKALIIATGSRGRTVTIPGEERLLGLGVSYCATCDGAFFRDQRLAVAGNNQEAVEEALFLTRFAHQVHLLAKTSQLKVPSELALEAQRHDKVIIHPSTRLRKVLGQARVEGVEIVGPGGTEQSLPVEGVFIYLQGGKPITDFLHGQLSTTETGCLQVDASMQTALLGVFAVGDVLCTHLKQAVVSAAEGAVAAMAAERFLSGRSKLRPDWSHG
jgi:thioredoxin reductase (NADPH)